MPFHVHAHMGDHPLIPGGHNWLDLRTNDVKINVADAAQAVPDAVRNAPLPTQSRVVSTTLAPGVVLMGGGSHNSVAVEFKDFVTVIEGPLSNQRTNAVVAEVHKLFPGKPIRYLVNTHNHFDHLGGVRGFVAEGATVITDDKNRNFYQRVVLAPQSRTLQPDRLSTRPFAPTGPGTLELQTFTDRYTISDGNETIELYHVEGLNHSDNMAIVVSPEGEDRDQCGPVRTAGRGREPGECECQRRRVVPQHQAAEARRGAACANPRQSRTERRFRADRRAGSGAGAGGRWRRLRLLASHTASQ